jgi:hypothetical protein
MHFQSHPLWLRHCNYIWRRVQFIDLLNILSLLTTAFRFPLTVLSLFLSLSLSLCTALSPSLSEKLWYCFEATEIVGKCLTEFQLHFKNSWTEYDAVVPPYMPVLYACWHLFLLSSRRTWSLEWSINVLSRVQNDEALPLLLPCRYLSALSLSLSLINVSSTLAQRRRGPRALLLQLPSVPRWHNNDVTLLSSGHSLRNLISAWTVLIIISYKNHEM